MFHFQMIQDKGKSKQGDNWGNSRPDRVNFALAGFGGDKNCITSPVAFVNVTTCVCNQLKTK